MENKKHDIRMNRGLQLKIERMKDHQRVSPEPIEKEVTTTLTSLSTLVKSKGKMQRQTSLYFRTRMSTRIKQGRPQTPTKTPIVIADSPNKQEKEAPLKKNEREGSSKQVSPKSSVTYARRPITRLASSKGKGLL